MLERLPFRAKLFAASTIALGTVALALTLSHAALMRAALHQQLLTHAAEHRPFVIAAFATPLAERDFASIQAIIREAVSERGLAHLAVTDPRGNVIAAQGWMPELARPHDGAATTIEGPDGSRRISFRAEIRLGEQLLGHAHFGLSYEPVQEALSTLILYSAVVALISLGLAIMLMQLVHRWITKPLVQMARASERIRDGDYDFELSASTTDDIGALTNSFRLMSTEIRERVRRLTESQSVQRRLLDEAQSREQALMGAKADLAAQTERLMISLDELRMQEQLLARALEYERELTQQQRRFVSVAAHEFRTPLTIIDGAAQRIARYADAHTPEELRLRAEKIRGAVTRMSLLIDATLDSARADAGAIAPSWSDVDLAVLVRRICARIRASGVALDVHVAGPTEGLCVQGDERRLDLVISKLITNAVKYSPAQRRVEVAFQSDGGDVELTVRDHGIGIPDADLPRLFHRFFRARNAHAIPGTGLGLSRAHDIVALHGGTIAVASRLGEGTTFTVRLPVRRGGA